MSAPHVSIVTSTTDAPLDGTKDWWNSSLAANAAANDSTMSAVFHCHGWLVPGAGRAHARQSNMPRMAYSVRCPALRMRKCAREIPAGEMWGINHRRIGVMNRAVWLAEPMSVDMRKMTSAHRSAGSQYLSR